jgi:hypothetical protein
MNHFNYGLNLLHFKQDYMIRANLKFQDSDLFLNLEISFKYSIRIVDNTGFALEGSQIQIKPSELMFMIHYTVTFWIMSLCLKF